MTADSTERTCWTRREFVRTGLATVGALAFGAWGPRGNLYGSLATESSADLDALAQSIRGRFLLNKSSGYDDARKVWNLAYDRHPLAMARCADLDDVRRCAAFVNQPIEVRELRSQFESWLNLKGEHASLMVRFGHGPTRPFSLRRPIDDVIIEERHWDGV